MFHIQAVGSSHRPLTFELLRLLPVSLQTETDFCGFTDLQCWSEASAFAVNQLLTLFSSCMYFTCATPDLCVQPDRRGGDVS